MKTKFFIVFLFCLIAFACKQNQITNPSNTKFIDTVSAVKYYSSDPINQKFQNIYRKWEVIRITGGITGAGFKPEFNLITFKKNGIYCLSQEDTLKEYGNIRIERQDSMLILKFIPEKIGKNYFSYVEKTVNLSHKDTLILVDPCCDLFVYEFKAVN